MIVVSTINQPLSSSLATVSHLQGSLYRDLKLEPDRTDALVHDRVAPLQGALDVLEVILDRIAVPQYKCKCAAISQVSRVFEWCREVFEVCAFVH